MFRLAVKVHAGAAVVPAAGAAVLRGAGAAVLLAAGAPVLLAAGIALLATPALAQDDGKLMDRAVAQLEAAVRSNPSDFKARTLLGRSYALLGQHDRALDQYKAAASLGDFSALLLSAEAYADRGDAQAAVAAYDAARLSARRAGDALRICEIDLGLAELELAKGNARKAAEVLDRIHAGDRQVVNTVRARLLALQGAARARMVLQEGPVAVWTEGARAREALEHALAVDESDPVVLFALGRFFLEAPPGYADPDKAALLLGRAAKVRPANVFYQAWRVRSLQVRGKAADSAAEVATFEKAFATSPLGKAMAEKLKSGAAPE